MTTQQIAHRLVELCRTGQNEKAYQELFAKDAVAIEPSFTPMPEVKGLDNLLKKNEQFGEMIDTLHGATVSDPLVAGNYFTVTMGIDYTGKDGKRMQMDEVCVYKVDNGKIVQEQFFF